MGHEDDSEDSRVSNRWLYLEIEPLTVGWLSRKEVVGSLEQNLSAEMRLVRS